MVRAGTGLHGLSVLWLGGIGASRDQFFAFEQEEEEEEEDDDDEGDDDDDDDGDNDVRSQV